MITITRSAWGSPTYSNNPYRRPVSFANRSIASWTNPGQSVWNWFAASRAWKNTSGFWAVPRSTG